MNNWKKKFIIIWSGQLFSILSSSIAQFAIVLWISLETGSAEVLSFATIAALLPQVVLGPFAGVFVDRWSRKWTDRKSTRLNSSHSSQSRMPSSA